MCALVNVCYLFCFLYDQRKCSKQHCYTEDNDVLNTYFLCTCNYVTITYVADKNKIHDILKFNKQKLKKFVNTFIFSMILFKKNNV